MSIRGSWLRRGSHTDGMPVRLHHIVIDADYNAPVGICLMPVTDPKTVKNRVRLDFTTSASDGHAEIERLLGLGARPVEIGQTGAESWTALADPEGNEFCVVRPKETLTRSALRSACPGG